MSEISYLSELSDAQRQLIISLPYQAGLYMSHADDIEGEHDDEREMKAIESCIKAYLKFDKNEPRHSSFTHFIAQEILNAQECWVEWADQSFHVLNNASEVMKLVFENTSEDETKNYQSLILDIVKSVAKAANELSAFDDFDNEEQEIGFFQGFMQRVMGSTSASQQNDDDLSNISPAEQSALSRLEEALNMELN